VFNEMFEPGKELQCLANDTRISIMKLEKNTLKLNDFIRKLDKTEGSQPGPPEGSAHDLLGTDQPGPD